MSINKQKMKLLPNVTQRYVFSKVTTFETLSVYATFSKFRWYLTISDSLSNFKKI